MFSLKKQIKYISTDWANLINEIIKERSNDKDFAKKLKNLEGKINSCNIDNLYPPLPLIFNAFNHFNFNDLKVVIIGQDPYHQKNQATGLAFSVNNSVNKVPPSLRNIIKEINNDLGIDRKKFDLIDWAKQGVLLLNSSLTVVDSKPNTHQKQWEYFTDLIISKINEKNKNIIFMLWGNYAKSKKKIIDTTKHFVLESVHPSPLSASRGWFGSKQFSKCNQKLVEIGSIPIDW